MLLCVDVHAYAGFEGAAGAEKWWADFGRVPVSNDPIVVFTVAQ